MSISKLVIFNGVIILDLNGSRRNISHRETFTLSYTDTSMTEYPKIRQVKEMKQPMRRSKQTSNNSRHF
jgi:hypothetical protein